MRQDDIADGIQEITLNIAMEFGSAEVGFGRGQGECYITRNGTEYRVIVEPYWNEKTDEPIGERDAA